MAATIKDYIRECDIYGYSQEHYDLMKECAEIDVAAKFIENQQFMAENASLFSGDDSFTEGYLVESVDQTTIDAVMQNFDEKVGNVKNTIMNGLKKAWNAIVAFLRKIRTIWDADSKRAGAIKDYLKKEKDMDEGKVATLKSIAKKAVEDSGFKVKANQPTLKEIKINYTSSDTDFSEMKNILAAGLAQNTAVAEVTGTGSSDTIGAICAKTVVKACKGVASAKGKDVVGIQSVMNAAWKDAQKNGVPIYVKTSDIDEMLKAMEEMKTALDQQGAENAEAENDPHATNVAENIRALNNVYSSITGCIGKTMNLYTQYKNFRAKLLAGMESYVKTHSGKAIEGGAKAQTVEAKVVDKDGKTVKGTYKDHVEVK